MKKIFLSLLSVFMLTTMQLFADGPLPYTLRVLTFEDADAKEGFRALAYDEDEDEFMYHRQNKYYIYDNSYDDADYDMYYVDDYGDPFSYSNPWSKLIAPFIDEPYKHQYGSKMLYYDDMQSGSTEQYYTWTDGGNTYLTSGLISGGWYGNYAYSAGGHAISHYWSGNFEDYGDYDYQLTVYKAGSSNVETSGGGYNGSDNFCVHYGYLDIYTTSATPADLPNIRFSDGVARVIDHMYVNNTTYTYHAYIDGPSIYMVKPSSPDDKVWIEAYGFASQDDVDNGNATSGPLTFYLVNGDDEAVTNWTKWDLSGLGEVVQVGFNIYATDFAKDGSGGLTFPAYFAYDDVAVRFPRDYYERTGLTAGNYGTICLPRNVAADDYEGAVFYKVVDRNAAGITLEEVTSLEKGKAYIFQATATTLRAYYTDGDDAVSEPATATTANIMQGSFLDNQVIPAGMWFIKNNQLWVSDGANDYVDANRAYLTDLTPMPSAPAPGRRRVNIPVHNDAPTSLNTVDTQDAQAVKMMQNGVIYIQKNGYLYNIQGQKAQ